MSRALPAVAAVAGALAAAGAAHAAPAGGGPAPAAEAVVAMSGSSFSPSRVTILAGESVRWVNQDARAHTATADGGTFDSGALATGASHVQRFERPGTIAYRCTLHRSMRGAVEVVAVALDAPAAPARPGATVRLTGRTPQPGQAVTLVRDGAAMASTVSGEGGAFAFSVVADAPATLRAHAGDLASAAVRLAIAPEVRLAAARRRGRVSLRVHVTPAQPGAVVAIERHERERFGYVPLRRVRLDAHSRGRVTLRDARRLRMRARLVRPVRGYAPSTGPVVVLARGNGSGRPAGGHRHG